MPTYHISDQKEQCNRKNIKDNSFKSCICLLLIFIALCGILFLASSFLQKSHDKSPAEDSEVEYLENYNSQNTLSPNEKIVQYATTSRTEKEQDIAMTTTREYVDEPTTPNISKIISTTSTTTEAEFLTTEASDDNLVTSPNFAEEVTDVLLIDTTQVITTATITEEDNTDKILSTVEETVQAASTERIEEPSTIPTEIIFEVMETEKDLKQQTETSTNVWRTTTPTLQQEQENISTTPFFTSTERPKTTTTTFPRKILDVLPTPQMLRNIPAICASNRCKSIASTILYHTDPGQDPCEDFYGFACGGPEGSMTHRDDNDLVREQLIAKTVWREVFKVKAEERSAGLNGMVEYLNVCVKKSFEGGYEAKLNNARGVLNSMNLHQFVVPNIKDSMVDLTVLFEKMLLTQLLPIFDVNVGMGLEKGIDFKLEISAPSLYSRGAAPSAVTSAQILLLHRRCFADFADRVGKKYGKPIDLLFKNPSGPYSGTDSLYERSVQERYKCVAEYRAGPFIETVLNASRAMLDRPQGVAQATLEAEIKEDVVTILDKMDKIFGNVDNTISNWELTMVYNFEIDFPSIKWVELFSKLTTKTFNQQTMVYIKYKNKLKEMFTYLQKLPAYKIYNAFIALFATDLYLNLVQPPERSTSITTHCQMESMSLFPHYSSALYIKSIKTSEQEAMDEFLEDIFTQLKMNLTGSLQGALWLDERSKTTCISILDQLSVYLANDDLSLGEDEINELYKNINISENYELNFVDLVLLKLKLRLKLHGNEFKVHFINGFFMNSYDVKPKEIMSENIIAIPMGIVDIYKPIGMPRFLVMAKIGIHVAQSLGRRFDVDTINIIDGMSLSWTSKQSYSAYISTATDQFEFAVNRTINKDIVLTQVASDISLRSRLVDNMAFHLIMDAFGSYQEVLTLPWLQELYTNEQVYVIATIQEFCKKQSLAQYALDMYANPILPPSIRVENMVMNSPAFAKAFECPDGARMNSPIKVSFPYLEAIESDEERDYN